MGFRRCWRLRPNKSRLFVFLFVRTRSLYQGDICLKICLCSNMYFCTFLSCSVSFCFNATVPHPLSFFRFGRSSKSSSNCNFSSRRQARRVPGPRRAVMLWQHRCATDLLWGFCGHFLYLFLYVRPLVGVSHLVSSTFGPLLCPRVSQNRKILVEGLRPWWGLRPWYARPCLPSVLFMFSFLCVLQCMFP